MLVLVCMCIIGLLSPLSHLIVIEIIHISYILPNSDYKVKLVDLFLLHSNSTFSCRFHFYIGFKVIIFRLNQCYIVVVHSNSYALVKVVTYFTM